MSKRDIGVYFPNNKVNKNRNSNITEEINITNEMKNAFENIDLSIKHKSFSNKSIRFLRKSKRTE